MKIDAYFKVLRDRWITVLATTFVVAALAVAYSLNVTPIYSASARLFVATPANSLNEAYNGNLFSQQRVASYAELIMGTDLAQRTIDHNGFDISAPDLAAKVTAVSSPENVLIDVSVRDTSAERAATFANALSEEFVSMVTELEIPPWQPPSASYVQVVVDQHATVPGTPVTPQTDRNIALGIIAGLLLGIALAALRQQFDTRLQSRDAVEESGDLPVLVAVPVDSEARASHVVSLDPPAPSGVAYRQLRTSLVLLNSNEPPKAITVASPGPGAGTTTVVINVARSLARANLAVVIVDGNLQAPAVARYLGVPNDSGLTNILDGRADLAEVLQTTAFDGVSVLPSGLPSSTVASELIGSNRFRGLMDDLRDKFDYVLIDGGALSSGSDTQVFAHESDGTLVVARFKDTKQAELRDAVKELRAVGANPIGVVVSNTPKSRRF